VVVIIEFMHQLIPISYGGLGTLILVCVNTSLENQPVVTTFLDSEGLNISEFVFSIGGQVSIFHAMIGLFIPLFMSAMLTKFFGRNRSFSEGLKVWPFALFAGLSFVIPYSLTANFLGPEFPSIIGGLTGLAIVIPLTRKGFLMPKETFDFEPRSNWDPSWISEMTAGARAPKEISMFKAWLPYVLVAVLLVITRIEPL